MYTANKRRRTEMLLGAQQPPPLAPAPPADGQRTGDCSDPRDELRRLALEVEPVVLPRAFATSPAAAAAVPSGSSPLMPAVTEPPSVIGYQPTYRAVLAKRGYLVRNTLGSGSYSKVKKVYCFAKRSVIQLAAVKIIDRQKAPQDYQEKFMPRELKHWPRLRHPNLVALTDWFQDRQRVYMVLEYADGGDALKHIQSTGAISEDRARLWTSQIASAVRYMHDLDIAHRDLKLENLLIDSSDNIKLCDFGFVREAAPGELSQTYCGSKSYAAPEILQGRPYDPKKADVWAIGVIVYIFVTGKMPFDETKGTKSILEEQRQLDFRWSRSRHLTVACQTLIRRMFTWDFTERPAVYAVLADSWFMPPSPPAAGSDYVASSALPSPSPPVSSRCQPGRRIVAAPQSPTSPVHRTLVAKQSAPSTVAPGARRCLQSLLQASAAGTAGSPALSARDDSVLSPVDGYPASALGF